MKTNSPQKASGLNMRSIFRCMMEDGYYPSFEQDHIQFGLDDNIAVVEYEEGIISVRLFFSIDEEAYDLFLEASNMTMLKTDAVKSVVLDDMQNLMFSCEVFCRSVRDARHCLARACGLLRQALEVHKSEMKKLIMASEVANATLPARDEFMAGSGRKTLS